MRTAVAGVALGLLLASAGCQGKTEELPLGCAGGPGRPATPASATEGRVVWSVPLEKGHAVSGPSAIGPLLYVPTSVRAQNTPGEHDVRFTAYDPIDGRMRWRQDGVLDQLDARAGTVYVSGVSGNLLAAVDTQTGRWRWARIADSTREEPSLASGGMHAAAGSGVVLVYRGGEAPGYLAAVDGEGAVLWTVPRPPHMIRDVLLRGDTIYVDSYELNNLDSRFQLSAREARTGQVRWQRDVTQPWEMREYDGRLAAHHGSEEEDGPATLVMMDGRTGATLWSHELGGYVSPFEFTYAEFVAEGFLHSYAGVLTMYDAASGEQRWIFDTHPNPENRRRNRSHAPGLIQIAPGGGLLIPGDDFLSCVDPATGVERWRTPTGVPFINHVTVTGDVAYAVGLRDPLGEDYSPVSHVLAVDLRTGTPNWRYERSGAAMTLLATTPEAVFVATKEHTVQRIGPPVPDLRRS
jgi:outer membrane protein assembly factor BamB